MGPLDDGPWNLRERLTSSDLTLNAKRLSRAFVDLLSVFEEAIAAPEGLSSPVLTQTNCLADSESVYSEPEVSSASEGTATPGDELHSSAHTHAMCLVAFLRRLEVKARRQAEAKQRHALNARLRFFRLSLERSATLGSPVSTSGSDTESVPSSVSCHGKFSLRKSLRVKWTGPVSRTVQVVGTFSSPPWSHCVDMKYDPECGAYVADITDAAATCKSRDLQLKFIVDGEWKLETTLPVCQDSRGNWNNRCRFGDDEPVPSDVSSPFTLSLYTAAARAAAAQVERAGLGDEGKATAKGDTERADKGKGGGIWWPRFSTDQEVEAAKAKPEEASQPYSHNRTFSDTSSTGSTSTPSHLDPASRISSHSADNLRRIHALSVPVSSYPESVLSHLHPPEMLLGLGPGGHHELERARENLSLQCGFFLLPHPDKAQTGGADAYFVAAKGKGGPVTVGVADGVGEWDSFDLDPRLFAEELMKGCCEAAVAEKIDGDAIDQRALEVLRKGYEATRSFGSSTALVVMHEGGDKIGIANIGDSAIIVLRRQLWYQMTCVFRSREQQHQFNCPFQLSRLPQPPEYEQLRASGKVALLQLLQNAAIIPQDTPDTAGLCSISVMEGDLLILGTDGVFDNLFDYEICGIATLTLSPFEAQLLQNEALATSATAVATAIGEAAAHRRTGIGES